MFVVRNFKNIDWEHVEFDERKSQFLLFFVVYHILSKTETWPFLRLLLRMNSLKINSERKNWIGMIMVRVLRVSTFATELNLTR